MSGTITSIQGVVKIQRAGSSNERSASSGARVDPGDAVITGPSGLATIKFEHGKVELDHSSRVTLLRCMSSRDEIFAEMALTNGALTALINIEKEREFWFDIVTPTQRARGQGRKNNETKLAVSHSAGGTTVTDSQVGQWEYQPIMLTDMPPAVQAVLTGNAKAATLMKTYIDTALGQSAMNAYDVTINAGAPNIGVVQPTPPPAVVPVETVAPAVTAPTPTPTPTPTPAPVPVSVQAPASPAPLSMTFTPQEGKSGVVSGPSTVTAGDK